MLTIANYFTEIKKVDRSGLPDKLKEFVDIIEELSDQHKHWKLYHADGEIKTEVDNYLKALNRYLDKAEKKSHPVTEQQARAAAKDFIEHEVKRGDSYEQIQKGQAGTGKGEYWVNIRWDKIHVTEVNGIACNYSFSLKSIYNELKAETAKQLKEKYAASAPDAQKKPQEQPVKTSPFRVSSKEGRPMERIAEEVKFIKRFVLLHNKAKTKQQLLYFINALQRAIVEKRIRKTSPYAKDIMQIQTNLVKMFNDLKEGERIALEIAPKRLENYMQIAGSEKIRLSIQYLKRYIGIHGKNITKAKAQALSKLIIHNMEKGNIKTSDPYFERIKKVLSSLKHFVSVARKNDTVEIHEAVLNGLNDAMPGCCCRDKTGLNGLGETSDQTDNVPKHTVLNSLDVVKLKSNKIGFTGRWLNFIGNPSKGFTMMIFGKPKFGKSILASDLAGYLARNHGRVLYIAMEEGFDDSLKERLESVDVAHENLDVADYMADDKIPAYDFIFIDSVNKAGLSTKDLEELEQKHPGKSFVYVFQTTKDGDFRGAMEFKHNADVVIEVPEKGLATQYGRYNQGGEMRMF